MSIGLLNEGPLHAALKAAYTANGGAEEVPVESFVADAVRGGVMYEIQTGSFSGLQRKMSALVEVGPVVLVHPLARTTRIVKVDDSGELSKPRKSPKREQLVHIVNELVYLPTLLNHPNFSVEAVLVDVEELRAFDPAKRRRRGGWRVVEKRLVEMVGGVRLRAMADLYDFLEDELPEVFGTRQLAAALQQPLHIAQKMAYCLRHAGVVEIVGKEGNALQYRNVIP